MSGFSMPTSDGPLEENDATVAVFDEKLFGELNLNETIPSSRGYPALKTGIEILAHRA